ncbi:MAG: sensor histidine kinase [Solirubrobacteraceae bacterium]
MALTTLPPSEPAAISLVVSDLSERKRLEDELRALSRDLERRVEQRTRELDEASKELEAFSCSVSHELQAPLRAIDIFSRTFELQHCEQVDAEATDTIERVRVGVAKLADLIVVLLLLSQLSQAEPQSQSVDLSALGREITEELRRRDPDRDVEVRIELGLHAVGDPKLLSAVLQYLTENAWKFTAGRDRGHIGLAAAGSCDRRPTFVVRDNGAGFDMAFADKLFSPFQRLHHNDEFRDMDIGLATGGDQADPARGCQLKWR